MKKQFLITNTELDSNVVNVSDNSNTFITDDYFKKLSEIRQFNNIIYEIETDNNQSNISVIKKLTMFDHFVNVSFETKDELKKVFDGNYEDFVKACEVVVCRMTFEPWIVFEYLNLARIFEKDNYNEFVSVNYILEYLFDIDILERIIMSKFYSGNDLFKLVRKLIVSCDVKKYKPSLYSIILLFKDDFDLTEIIKTKISIMEPEDRIIFERMVDFKEKTNTEKAMEA